MATESALGGTTHKIAAVLFLSLALVFVVTSQTEGTAVSLAVEPLSPHLAASHDKVIPNQTITIDVLQHEPADNPYQLLWVDSNFSVEDIISPTLSVGADGSRRDIPFAIPGGASGTHFFETRRDETLVARSTAIEIVAPLYTHLPLMMRDHTAIYRCPDLSSNQYTGGTALQAESDNPVRPAYNHADKNIALRSYALNTDLGLKRELVDYGSGDPTQPPQIATLFAPYRVPDLNSFYRVHHWNWALSPEPGTRGEPITFPPATALGLATTRGETLHVPASGYSIGAGYEVIVLFADEDTITLKYGRDDTAARGYTLHLDSICTDANLLTLYNRLDNPSGPRYIYGPPDIYDLPVLVAGQPLGTAQGNEIVVAIVDTGAFQDPRSCNEWWQIRPGYVGSCPLGP